jgi:hypothetical protein
MTGYIRLHASARARRFQQTVIAGTVEDDVVQQADAHNLTCGFQLPLFVSHSVKRFPRILRDSALEGQRSKDSPEDK